jgi:uncharacterized protein YecT (DUF1311 family)
MPSIPSHQLVRRAAAAIGLALAAAAVVAQAVPRPQPIEFARGASSGRVHGGIARGEVTYYRFAAAEGQWGELAVHSVEGNAVMTLFEPGWRLVPADGGIRVEGQSASPLAAGDESTSWSGVLPASGEYLVVVGAIRGGAEFDLDLGIEALTEEHCGDLAQQPMNYCTGVFAANLERERVKVERSLATTLGEDRVGLLGASEAGWKKYRDAQCELEASSFEGGSLQPTIYNSCLTELTRQRLQALRRLLEMEGG